MPASAEPTSGRIFGRVADAYACTRPRHTPAALEPDEGMRALTAGLAGPVRFEETVRITGRDLVDLHLTGSTPASIGDEEREAMAQRAYPLMDEAYDLRVVTHLYWRLLP